jgi:hypothetical protein
MAEKDSTERRVYNLPLDLLERLRAYQMSQGITSEVEAARRLLDSALQMRDTIEDILNTLSSKFLEERDLRVIAADVLIKHALVSHVQISDTDVTFILKNGFRGKISSSGALYSALPDSHDDDWNSYRKKPARVPVPSWDSASSGETASAGGNLDDDIPF